MTATNDEVLAELKALRATVEALAPLRAMVEALLAGKPVASASDVDGKGGDPALRFDVKNVGMSTKGKKMSTLPANVLDRVAHMLDYFADKEEAEGKSYNGKPTAPWTRLDAARARRWALRRRMGWKPESEPAAVPPGAQDSLPALGGGPPLGAGDGGLPLGTTPTPARAGIDLADDDDDDLGFDDVDESGIPF